MDVEKLITLIYEKKPLWDMADKSYHMRDIQRKLWQEVAVEINTKGKLNQIWVSGMIYLQTNKIFVFVVYNVAKAYTAQ